MKLITEIDDDVLFMSTLYKIASEVQQFLDSSQILKIRERIPDFSVFETDEEKKEATREQQKANLMEMLKVAMVDYPEAVISIAKKMIVLNEGEDYPHGMALFGAICNVLSNNEVIDFFTSFVKLGTAIRKI